MQAKPIRYEAIPFDGCHISVSHATNRKGKKWQYPRICRDGKQQLMHRYLYEQRHGPIPAGKVVRHKCDNTLCINVDHMILGSVADNNNDMVTRKRYGCMQGIKNPNAKLTEADVMTIYHASRLTGAELSRIYGVGENTVSRIRTGISWRHLTVGKAGV